MRNIRGTKDQIRSQMINQIVLTRHNNKTHRIDDVAFDMTPNSTFTMKDTKITFREYYAQLHNIMITDIKQPMLVIKANFIGVISILIPLNSDENVMKRKTKTFTFHLNLLR
jgi:hypothetical protein